MMTNDAEAPIVWPKDMKSRLIGKYPDERKDRVGRKGDDRG